MFSSSNNKGVLLRGIELLASTAPDSERQLLELLKNSKDLLKQDYSILLRNPLPAASPPQLHNAPHPMTQQQQPPARNGAAGLATPPRPRANVEQPIPPKAKMMKTQPIPQQPPPTPSFGPSRTPPNPNDPFLPRSSKPAAGAPPLQQQPPQVPQQQQLPPRAAFKQQLPQQTPLPTSPKSPHYPHPTAQQSQQPLKKRDRTEDDFYPDENAKDAGSSEEEEEDDDPQEEEFFPVKKKRPRAVVF